MNEGFGFRLIAILILAVCIVMLSARVYKLQQEVDRLRQEWDEFIEEIFYPPDDFEDQTYMIVG